MDISIDLTDGVPIYRQIVNHAAMRVTIEQTTTNPGTGVQEIASGCPHPRRSGSFEGRDMSGSFPCEHLQIFVSMAEVQSRLIDLGYYDGKVDGEPSQLTTAALARFQHDRGLPPTGEPDPETMQALKEAYCY